MKGIGKYASDIRVGCDVHLFLFERAGRPNAFTTYQQDMHLIGKMFINGIASKINYPAWDQHSLDGIIAWCKLIQKDIERGSRE